jgi:hypothetical protein
MLRIKRSVSASYSQVTLMFQFSLS